MITRTALPAALLLTAGLVAGCGGGSDDDVAPTAAPPASPSPTSPSPTPPATAAPSPTGPATPELETCRNDEIGVVVRYPAGWEVRERPEGGGCAYFDPEPFEVAPATDAAGMTVRLSLERAEYERVLEGYRRDEVLDERDAVVAGRPGTRIESRSTEGPTGGVGRQLTYLVDQGDGTTLLLTTNESDAADPEEGWRVVDLMAEQMRTAG